MIRDSIKFVFFGTPALSAEILDFLKSRGLIPAIIVTNPDRPQGRKMHLTPPPVKLWALANSVPVLQPENFKDPEVFGQLSKVNCQLFIVVAYGKIIPKQVLAIPKKGTLNIHYSLLPKYRGASPIESAILNDDRETGVSIMLMDEKMDHGPVVAERGIHDSRFKIQEKEWPIGAKELRERCNKIGAELLAETIPLWVAGKIKAREQDHSQATYTKKFIKEDGLIDFSEDPYKNFLKIRAFESSIGTYFFATAASRKIRVKITDAKFENGQLRITRVIPEGKKEMAYDEFLRGTGQTNGS